MEFNLNPIAIKESCGLSKFPPLSEFLASILVFASSPISEVESIFTNLSLEPTWRWYFAMTPFETVFLFLVIGQFAVMNTLGIMPVNLSNLINGMPSGRRKRDITDSFKIRRELGSKILKLLRRLDPNECTFRVICEMQSNYLSKPDWKLSDETKLTLTSLKRSGEARRKRNDLSVDNFKQTIPTSANSNIDDFEDAVEMGFRSHTSGNYTLCQEKYSCPSSSEEILDFINVIGSHNFSL